MKFHACINELCSLFATLSFIIAVVSIAKSGAQYSIAPHHKLGLAMLAQLILKIHMDEDANLKVIHYRNKCMKYVIGITRAN